MTIMNRRKLFSFLAASPIGVLGAAAQAKQPLEISVERINVGRDYEIAIRHGDLCLKFSPLEK
jgi:hypothetical protein